MWSCLKPWIYALVLWLGFSQLFIPPLIRWIYESDRFAAHELVMEAKKEKGADGFVADWRVASLAMATAIVLTCLSGIFLRSSRTADRLAGTRSASQLGWIRLVTATVLLISLAFENLPSSAYLPREMQRSMGFFDLIRYLPGMSLLMQSPVALGLLQVLAGVLLLLAALGWRTRITVPAAAAGSFVVGGILRSYFRFYHQGLIPLYVLSFLSFTPAGHGLSIETSRRHSSADGRTYGWSCFGAWLIVSLSYLDAALSKLRRGGIRWFEPVNIKANIVRDSMNPMELDPDLGLLILDAPEPLFFAFGVIAFAIELLFPLVLVSTRARHVLPFAAAAMHIGIWLLQGVLFLDLILLQLIFLDLPRWRQAATDDQVTASKWSKTLQAIAAVMLWAWALRVEFYPLTGAQMYAAADTTGVVEYHKVIAHYQSGRSDEAPLSRWIGAVSDISDTRYRKVVKETFEPKRERTGRAFLRACAARYNESSPSDRLVALEIQKWRWDFAREPELRGGRLTGSLVEPVP